VRRAPPAVSLACPADRGRRVAEVPEM